MLLILSLRSLTGQAITFILMLKIKTKWSFRWIWKLINKNQKIV